MTWIDEQVDQCRLALRAYQEDNAAKAEMADLRVLRHRIRQEIIQHLTSFLEGESTLQEFNALFQQQAHCDWNIFGVRGISGGVFLNKLINYIPHHEQLMREFRVVLSVPEDAYQGQHWMQALILFLEGTLAAGQIRRSQLQPARLPFFLSIWWHIQNEEQWPRFAGNLRRGIFRGLPLADPATNQVELYFIFREHFLALKESFGISAWELEHFLIWHEQKLRGQARLSEDFGEKQQKQRKHTMLELGKIERGNLPSGQARRLYLQWLLAKMGKKVGCQVWIAQQDHEKSWNEESFRHLSIPSLPLSEHGNLRTQLENVAVLWLRKNEVIAAYEIDPKNGELVASLLRLYDFGVIYAKRQPQLCLVLPRQQFEQASFELSRPLFCQQQEKLQCALLSIEDLVNQAEHILRWATSPVVIEDLLFFPKFVREKISLEK